MHRCNQQTNCSILASTNVFGDPCPGTLKYLEAHYQCVPGMYRAHAIRRPITTTTFTSCRSTLVMINLLSSFFFVAMPTSSTARPRPPWFSSVGPSIWNTLGLQNASAPATSTTTAMTSSTTTESVETVGLANATSTTAASEQNATTTTSTTTAATTTTTTTPSTTTPLPNLLVELTEVTVLVPDFPGRRPQSSSTPLPPTTSSSASAAVDDQDIGLDVVDQEEEDGDADQNGDLLTTPGSSTTGNLFFFFFFYRHIRDQRAFHYLLWLYTD